MIRNRPIRPQNGLLGEKVTNRVNSLMANSDLNFSLAPNRAISDVELDSSAKGGRVEVLKSAFEVLMSGKAGDTRRKTPGKRPK